MFRGQRTAVLRDNLESWSAWDKKDEAGRFASGFQGKSPRWAEVIRKCSTDPSKPGRRVLGRGWLLAKHIGGGCQE
jgi:hypothetical protein